MTTAPGLALQTLLREAKPAHLKDLIGPNIVDVLVGLDPSLAEGSRLADVAVRLLDPFQALQTPEKRDKIIEILPLAKARELAGRLGAASGRDLYDNLKDKASGNKNLPALLSFFGVVREERAAAIHKSSVEQISPKYELFEHQRQAALKTGEKLSHPPHKVVLHMPTGAGKTRTAMHIVADHLRATGPTVVCWLAQSAELLEQAADEFQNAWDYLGNRAIGIIRFWGNSRVNLLDVNDGFVVAGLGKIHAFSNRKSNALPIFADRVSLVIMDEAHQAIAPTYASSLEVLSNKRYKTKLLGLTATPGRTWADIEEDKKLSEFFDEEKVTLEVEGYKDPVSFLIGDGYLARPKFRTLNSEAGLSLSDKDATDLAKSIDIPSGILEKLGDDAQRNLKIIAEIEDLQKHHRRIIVFAPSVACARLLAAILFVRGHEADVVTGETGASEREQIIRRFRSESRNSMILCNYAVLTAGFDAPSVSAALIARPTKSLVLYSQMVGRATRGPKAGGNEESEIITVVDPHLPGFGDITEAFTNWEDVWHETT